MKPVARGVVTVGRPVVELEEEFARALGDDGDTSVERAAEPGRYRATSGSGRVRIVQEFAIEGHGPETTELSAVVWVRPAVAGWLVRRILGRKRLQRRVDDVLHAMARRAGGLPPEDEWEPDEADWLDDDEDAEELGGGTAGTREP